MHVNILNLDALVFKALSNANTFREPLLRWADLMLRRELQQDEFAAVAHRLGLRWKACVTAREFMQACMQEAWLRTVSTANLAFPSGSLAAAKKSVAARFHVLTPEELSLPWMARALENGNAVIRFDVLQYDSGTINHLMEAIEAVVGERDDYTAVTLDAAFKHADEWQKLLEHKALSAEGAESLVLEDELSDLSIVCLNDKQALVREGYMMKHCIGSYEINKRQPIWSVRSSSGKTIHATVELWLPEDKPGAAIVQVRGPVNSPVSAQIHQFVKDAVISCYGCICPSEERQELQLRELGIQGVHGFLEWRQGQSRILRAQQNAPIGALLAAGQENSVAWAETGIPISRRDIEAMSQAEIQLLIVKLRQSGAQI